MEIVGRTIRILGMVHFSKISTTMPILHCGNLGAAGVLPSCCPLLQIVDDASNEAYGGWTPILSGMAAVGF